MSTVPIEVNGQLRLFNGETRLEDLREELGEVRLRGDRDRLFTEPAEVTWP